MNILYINACVRRDSRTNRIARALLEKTAAPEDTIEELRLDALNLLPLNEERLNRRTELIARQAWDHPMFQLARQFAGADRIVIAAPYWDGSFPALLKLYIENIYVTGIVTEYDANGQPKGLCRAERLDYVVTAGGPYDDSYSYRYLRDLAVNFFGIPETRLVHAEMLDVQGFDAERIVAETIAAL